MIMVYVDDRKDPYRGMLMCHMIADTETELHQMAVMLGLKRTYFHGKENRMHYNVCQSKKAEAIRLGAQAITRRELITILKSEITK